MKSENEFKFRAEEDSTDFLLWQVYSQWQRGKNKVLEKYGLTSSQLTLLATIYWLKQQKQDITQILLSKTANIDQMTTSTVLRTLEKKGFISRVEHSADTRAKAVDLSASGKKITVAALHTVDKYNELYFSALGANAKAFNQTLIHLLKHNKNE